jgi:hypothetical protein
MLSGLLYSKYRQLLEAKCSRAGVELIRIDPAGLYVDHRCSEVRIATGLECACWCGGRDRPSRAKVD